MKSDFCERLKELREKNKVTLRDLGKAIDVNYSTISRWENDEISPSLDNIIKLCDFFDVSADYLLGRID